MELNKETHWNKLYLQFNYNLPNNFCDYFWGSLKTLVLSLFLTILSFFLVTSLLSPIILIFEKFDRKGFWSSFQITGIILWIMILIVFIIYKAINYYENKPYKYKHKKQSIIKTWYLDFKNKHCTMINWK